MERSESLRRFVLEFYVALNSHDEAAVKERCSAEPEASMIGTDGDECIGGDAVLAAFARQFVEFADVVFEADDVIASGGGARSTLAAIKLAAEAGRDTGAPVV